MSDQHWYVSEYEGFEIHVLTIPRDSPESPSPCGSHGYTFVGYVCHPGDASPGPDHTVQFHADGNDVFENADEALREGRGVGRSIIDGTHADLSVLPLVTRHT